jgi:tetratricopeptide (TPR) repeat protein
VNLAIDDPVWDVTVFPKNPASAGLLEGEAGRCLFKQRRAQARLACVAALALLVLSTYALSADKASGNPPGGMSGVLRDRGRDLLRAGEYQAARAFYDWSLGVNPKDAGAYHGRGLAWLGLGRTAVAIDDFERALALGEPPAGPWFHLGLTYSASRDLPAAEHAYTQAVLHDPQFIAAYFNRGIVRLRRQRADEAQVDFDLLCELRPEWPAALYGRAISRSMLGRYQDAMTDFGAVIRLEPGFAGVYGARGQARFRAGEFRGAADDFSLAISRAPDNPDLRVSHAMALFRLGRTREALAEMGQALERTPDAARAHLIRGRMLAEMREYPAAIDEYAEAAELDPKSPEPLLERGNLRFDLVQFEAALEDFTAALGLDPAHESARMNRAATEFHLGSMALACGDWKTACERRIESACALAEHHCSEQAGQ